MYRSIPILLLGFYFICATTNAYAQDENVNFRPMQEELLEESARILYIDKVVSDSLHPSYDDPNIDTVELNKISHDLKLINSYLSATDSLRFLRSIRPRGSVRSAVYYFTLSSGELEFNAEDSADYSSFPPDLQNFMETYHFHSVKQLFDLGEDIIYTATTNHPFNYYALRNEMEKLEVVDIVDYMGGYLMGGGDNLGMKTIDGRTVCTINISWGDCQAGCIHGRFWEFEILENSVTHLRTYGDKY